MPGMDWQVLGTDLNCSESAVTLAAFFSEKSHWQTRWKDKLSKALTYPAATIVKRLARARLLRRAARTGLTIPPAAPDRPQHRARYRRPSRPARKGRILPSNAAPASPHDSPTRHLWWCRTSVPLSRREGSRQ